MNLTVTILGLVLGIIGLVATIFGVCLAYISYVNPWIRFKWYLKNSNLWEKVILDNHLEIYRSIKHPGFQIITDLDKPIVENFQEEWMRSYPDKNHNVSYFVRLEANGIFIRQELFVSIDGGRGFVPVPQSKLVDEKIDYYFDKTQIQLANIFKEYPRFEKNILEFASHQKIPIKIIDGD